MRNILRPDRILILSGALIAAPAFAGVVLPGAPAPIAGVGIGALALLGLGYRALSRRKGD